MSILKPKMYSTVLGSTREDGQFYIASTLTSPPKLFTSHPIVVRSKLTFASGIYCDVLIGDNVNNKCGYRIPLAAFPVVFEDQERPSVECGDMDVVVLRDFGPFFFLLSRTKKC